MSASLKKASLIGTVIAALMALMIMIAAPALAGNDGPGKSQGKGNGVAKQDEASAAASEEDGDSSGNSDHSNGNASTDGDPTEPQPPSNGDFSGNGANKNGPYDSTRDGSPSGNGNGGGNAGGKPCAGCVGKADNKNPPGQMPGGSDHNNGYECDGNSGIGKTNPAHTGCTEPPEPPCDPQVEDCEPEEPPCDPLVENCGGNPPVCDPQIEDCDPGDVDGDIDNTPPDDDVLGRRFHRGGPPAVAGKIIPKVVGGAILPFTGAGNAVIYLVLGLFLMLSGGLLWRLNRN